MSDILAEVEEFLQGLEPTTVDWDTVLSEAEGPVFLTPINQLGLPVPCRICGCTDRWQMFIAWDGKHNFLGCVHAPLCELLPIRLIDTLPLHGDRPVREDEHYTNSITDVVVAHSPYDADYPGVRAGVDQEDEHYALDT